MKKRMLSLITALTLCVSMLPTFPVQAAEMNYYVSNEAGSDSNPGTENAPVKTLNKALELVEGEGATITLLDNVMVEDANNDDAPLVIDKKVTIKGDADSLPTITVRAGGVILGADVTFQDLKIGTAGFLRPGIAANGHKLQLLNVYQDSTLRALQIYGGSFFDATDISVDYGADIRGTNSDIVISGGSYEAVYAGSANGSVDLPVSISVTKGKGLTLGGIYVGSTYKNPADISTAGMIPVLDRSIRVPGAVEVSVSENASVTIVDGVAESHDVALMVEGTGQYSFGVNCIDSLTVNGGTFVLAEGSSFADGTGSAPDVTLVGSDRNKATLDLSEGCTGYETITVGDFTGTANGILVLPKEGSLTVEGTLAGGPTELRLNGGMPWSSAENPGYSGWMEYGTTYINSAVGDGTFVISNPYPTQTDIAFTTGSSAANGWKTVEGSLYEPPQLVDFTPISQTVTYEDANTVVGGYGAVNIEVTTTYAEDELLTDLSFVPLDYQITYTDEGGNATTYIQQASAYDSETDYYWCNYTASTASAASETVLMKLEPAGDTINICKGGANLAAGTYDIAITAVTTSGVKTRVCRLTVLSEGQSVPEATTTALRIEGEELAYSEAVDISANVTYVTEGIRVETGKVQLYINDIAYGEAIDLSASDNISWTGVSAVADNGFRIGSNEIKAVYLGAEGYTSSNATGTITVNKADSYISYSGDDYFVSTAYDGRSYAFTAAEGTVQISVASNLLIENPVPEEHYVVLYSETGEDFVSYDEIKTSCWYNVYLQALGSDYWKESEKCQVGQIYLSPATPAIKFSVSELTYTQAEDVITASGEVTVELSGVSEGVLPEGTVTLYGVRNNDISERTVLGTGDAVLVNGKATFHFSEILVDYMEWLIIEYTPTTDAPYEAISFYSSGNGFYTNYVQLNEGGDMDCTINGIETTRLYFASGQTVTVEAGRREGYSFAGWEFFGASSGYSMPEIENVNVSPITFIMPEGDVYMSAAWKQDSIQKWYTITLPSGEGYTIIPESESSVVSGASYSFTLVLGEDYEAGEDFGVSAGEAGAESPLTPIALDTQAGTYSYTITDITADQNIIVEGVVQKREHAEICPSAGFADIDSTQWYHEAVDYVVENGLMGGYGEGLFGPGDNLSRAQLAQILYAREGKPQVVSTVEFPDVSENAWYAEAVSWAAANGIVSGYGNGNFGPNDPITREQLALMLWRYADSPEAVNRELDFSDVNQIDGWAMEAMCWAVENTIIGGKGNGILDPNGNAHRAHVAQMLRNFLMNE